MLRNALRSSALQPYHQRSSVICIRSSHSTQRAGGSGVTAEAGERRSTGGRGRPGDPAGVRAEGLTGAPRAHLSAFICEPSSIVIIALSAHRPSRIGHPFPLLRSSPSGDGSYIAGAWVGLGFRGTFDLRPWTFDLRLSTFDLRPLTKARIANRTPLYGWSVWCVLPATSRSRLPGVRIPSSPNPKSKIENPKPPS